MGPFSGPSFFDLVGTLFDSGRGSEGDSSRHEVWRWSNYLQSLCPSDRTLVLLNIDETNVKLVLHEPKGHVCARAYRLHVQGVPMGRDASLSARRSCTTHMAAICDRPEFQRLLPQAALIGERQVSEARYETIQRNAPEGVQVWRLPTAWMNATLMQRYLRLLGTCLCDFMETHRFILYLDAHKVHITPAVLRVASLMGLWICVIPSKMTWVMQPLDTHLFAGYKRLLGSAWSFAQILGSFNSISACTSTALCTKAWMKVQVTSQFNLWDTCPNVGCSDHEGNTVGLLLLLPAAKERHRVL